MGEINHKYFLNLTKQELETLRNSSQTKYSNLHSSSVCSGIIIQTLQELQILKENYEDSALSLSKSSLDQTEEGLNKIFDGLQKHVNLQNNLLSHYETVVHEHKNLQDKKYFYSPTNDQVKEEDLYGGKNDDNSAIKVEPDFSKFVLDDMGLEEGVQYPSEMFKVEADIDEYENETIDFESEKSQSINFKSEIFNGNEDWSKKHNCNYCGKGFDKLRLLTIHIRIHTGEKPHECEVCKKRFRVSKCLKEHMYTHTSVKPFKCEICGMGFHNKKRLNKHMNVHSEVKPYSCDVCGQNFKTKSWLKEHSKKHEEGVEYKPQKIVTRCALCDIEFQTKREYQMHKKEKHRGEKPFSCKVCEKNFSE